MLQIKHWNGVDFKVNKAFWNDKGHSVARVFRIINLHAIFCACDEVGVVSSLYGKTLKNFVEAGKLLPDHDDDIIIYDSKNNTNLSKLLSKLRAQGFEVIRSSDDMLSVCKYLRYVDIHIRRDIEFEVSTVEYSGGLFKLFKNPTLEINAKYGSKATQKIQMLYVSTTKIKKLYIAWKDGYYTTSEIFAKAVAKFSVKINSFVNRIIYSCAIKKKRVLTEDEFLDLKLDKKGAVNWSWRQNHLKIFIKEEETLGDVVKKFSNVDLHEYVQSIVIENDFKKFPIEPINMSRGFWKSGNNFFLYPLLFGFRHNVIPYEATNIYLQDAPERDLYRYEYFDKLKPMNDDEIIQFLRENPLEIRDGCFTSGRHRATAMLGRIIQGKPYLPVYVRERRL